VNRARPRQPIVLAAVVAAFALALVGCGDGSSASRNPTGSTVPVPGDAQADLAAAVTRTLEPSTGRTTVTIEMSDLRPAPAGEPGLSFGDGELTLNGSYDLNARRAETTMTFPADLLTMPSPDSMTSFSADELADLPAEELAQLRAMEETLSEQLAASFEAMSNGVRQVFDLASNTGYREVPATIDPAGRGGWETRSLDANVSPAMARTVFDPLGLDPSNDGRSFLRYLDGATDVRAQADGSAVRYEGVIRTTELPPQYPLNYSEGETIGDREYPFRAWVEASGVINRLEIDLNDVDGELVPWDAPQYRQLRSAQVVVEFRDLDAPVTIDLPAESEILPDAQSSFGVDPMAGMSLPGGDGMPWPGDTLPPG